METKNFQITVPKTFPVTAGYSQDWIREQVKLVLPQVKQFEVQDIKVDYVETAPEKTITATCILYHY
jgi:hypothetical protein